MKITREETSSLEVVLNVELESDDLGPYLDRSFRRVVNRIEIPGFRRGKAPRPLVENYVGREALLRESLDYILQESLNRAMEEEKLETFGEPDVELVEIDPLSFKAVVALEPIVDLGDFRNLQLEPEATEVTQEQVDKVIEQLQYDAAPWEPVDRPVNFGDLVTLDVDGSIEGKNIADDRGVDFIPAQDNLMPLPGFSIYLEGMKRDESKEFTLSVPEDYRDDTIAGKDCRFKVKVLEIKEKVLPELDGEFAKGVGDGYESLEALQAGILENLTEQVERVAQRAFQESSLEEVIKGASIEVSDLTTNREIDHLLEEQLQAAQGRQTDMDTYLQTVGKSPEELRDEARPTAQERLTRFLVIRKLAQEEGIEVAPQEIDDEVENLTSISGEASETLRQAFSTDNARSSLGSAILTRKVLERLAQIIQEKAEEAEAPEELDPASIEKVTASVEESTEESALPSSQHTGEGQSEEEGGNPGDN